jgi:hypothetical protein
MVVTLRAGRAYKLVVGRALHLELFDAFGTPVDSLYVLEHPDGKLEEGRLERGVLHREDVPEGEFKVHLSELVAASWSVEAVTLPGKGGAPPEVEVVLEHFGLGPEREATLRFFHVDEARDGEETDLEQDEEASLFHEVKQRLATDAARLLEAQETRVRWRLEGFDEAEPGAAFDVVCRVTCEGLEARTPPLAITAPPADLREDLRVEWKDAFGAALDGLYVLEHPDGKLEEGRFADGVLDRKGLLAGEYAVHLAELVEARWSVSAVEVPAGGRAPEVEVVLRHFGLGPAHEATFEFLHPLESACEEEEDTPEDGQDVVVGEVKRKLAADAARLLEEQETRVRWTPPIEALEAGSSVDFVCRVRVGALETRSAPLAVVAAES